MSTPQNFMAALHHDVAVATRWKTNATLAIHHSYRTVLRLEIFARFISFCKRVAHFLAHILASSFCYRNLLLLSLVVGLQRLNMNDTLSVVRLIKQIGTKVEEHVMLIISEQAAVCDNSKAKAKSR